MNILSINYEDLAGLSYNLCTAINELTDHHAISVILHSTWIRYPTMLAGKSEIQAKMPELMRNADVIHINERPGLLPLIGARPEDCQDKQIIYHALGSRFRRRAGRYLNAIYTNFPQAKVIVATPDLIPLVPEATWFPAVIPIGKHSEKYPIQRNDPPVIYGAQTKPNRYRPLMLRILKQLQEEGLDFDIQWTYGKQHHTNLTLKSQADIYYDGFRPMFGVNALEASCFKMPVVASAIQVAKDHIDAFGINCPYLDPYLSSPEDQKDELRKLITDENYRDQRGEAGFQYVREVHSPEIGVKRFFALLEE